MRLKSFHAPSMAEAMRVVRETLGDDAIIVATREEEGGVRLTAAIDDVDPSPPPLPYPQAAESSAVSEAPRRVPDLDTVDLVSDALSRHGTPPLVVDRVVNTLSAYGNDDPLDALTTALDKIFTFQPLPTGRTPRPLFLVGPPGAGKTLTIAKLATRERFAGRKAGVITTDTVRAGGVDQLAIFTKLLKLKLLVTDDAEALAEALGVHRGAHQILIDSAGRNPFDHADMAEMKQFLDVADIEPVLVLPAGGDASEAADVGSAFREMGARRLLLTRVDMTRRLGSLLAIAYEARLSFSDISVTPQVAEGLQSVSAGTLARLLLPAAHRQTGDDRNQSPKDNRQSDRHHPEQVVPFPVPPTDLKRTGTYS